MNANQPKDILETDEFLKLRKEVVTQTSSGNAGDTAEKVPGMFCHVEYYYSLAGLLYL